MTRDRIAAVLRSANLLLFWLFLYLLKNPGGRLIDLTFPSLAIAVYLLAGAGAAYRGLGGAKTEAVLYAGDILLVTWACAWTHSGETNLPLALYLPSVLAALRFSRPLAAGIAGLAAAGLTLLAFLSANGAPLAATGWGFRLTALLLIPAAAAVFATPSDEHANASPNAAHERQRGMLFNEFINYILFQVREYLTSITTTSEHLARTASEPAVRDLGGKLQRMIVELNGKVGRMLRTVKTYTTGRRPMSAKEFSLEDLLQECLNNARRGTNAEKVKTRLWCDPNIGPLPWERDLLAAAFTAVLTNAFEATAALGEEGRLNISARLEDGVAKVEAIDNGGGIPDVVRKQLFLPLFTTKASQGTLGLGLSMARRMLERSGGSIELRSEKGKTFASVIVPLQPTLPIIRTTDSTWSGRRQDI